MEITVKYYFTAFRMVSILQRRYEILVRMSKYKNCYVLLVGKQTVKNDKLFIELLYFPEISLLWNRIFVYLCKDVLYLFNHVKTCSICLYCISLIM